MPSRLPPPKLAKLLRRLEDTDDGPGTIADDLKIHRTTVWRIRTSMDLFNTPYPLRGTLHGPAPLLNAHVTACLLDWLKERPTAYLDEMQWYLFDEHDVVTSVPTIHGAIYKAGWSRKAAKKRLREQNEELRAA